MAAGSGFKTFATGDVLTAADTNGYLMQGIWVFANAAARDAAVTSPQEGNACYLKDTDAVQTYSGSAWVAVGGGGLSSPLTTKGDVWGYSTTNARIPIGTNGQVLTADSTAALGLKWGTAPSGKIIQVVNGQATTNVNSSSSTYADTGLTATITPTSATSTILVMVTQNSLRKDNDAYMALRLFRNGSNILQLTTATAYTATTIINNIGSVAANYLDSPATTSATTYKTQFASGGNNAQVGVQSNNDISTITLMEIGA